MDVSQSDSQDFEMSTDSSFSNLTELKTANISISSLLTDQIKGNVREFEAVAEEKINQNAWGEHLNNKKPVEPVKVQETNQSPPIRPTLRLKMSSYSFSKRNPRKSLPSRSRDVSSSSSLSASSLKSSLPDLETVLIQKYKDTEETVGISKMIMPEKRIVNEVDKGWLNRCASDNSIMYQSMSQSPASESDAGPKRFGLKNINVSALTATNSSFSATTLSDTSTSFGMSALTMNSQPSVLNSSAENAGKK